MPCYVSKRFSHTRTHNDQEDDTGCPRFSHYSISRRKSFWGFENIWLFRVLASRPFLLRAKQFNFIFFSHFAHIAMRATSCVWEKGLLSLQIQHWRCQAKYKILGRLSLVSSFHFPCVKTSRIEWNRKGGGWEKERKFGNCDQFRQHVVGRWRENKQIEDSSHTMMMLRIKLWARWKDNIFFLCADSVLQAWQEFSWIDFQYTFYRFVSLTLSACYQFAYNVLLSCVLFR